MKPRKTAPERREARLRRNLTPEEYKALSAPDSAEFPSGQTPKRKTATTKAPPLNFLLGCSDADLGNLELARLAEVANLRTELHATLDKLIDQMAQAALMAWFRITDRDALKRALENPEDVIAWAKERIRDGQRRAEELIPRASLEPGAAHLAAALRYAERNMAEGKCSVCPKPLAHHSVRYCEEHLAKIRVRDRQKKGLSDPGSLEYLYSGEVTPSTHGRQPGTLKALKEANEKRKRGKP